MHLKTSRFSRLEAFLIRSRRFETMCSPLEERIKRINGKGIYVLHLELTSDAQIMVGRLGAQRFGAGYYAYVGRAFGPGGLAARLAHHLRQTVSPHWHLDYLRAHGQTKEVWYSHSAPHSEHQWAQALMHMRGAMVPADGFGSSDCRCRSHLVKFPRRPRKTTFRRRLIAHSTAVVAPIHCMRAGHRS
jgi:Uri superfamily endonuclease